MSSRWSINITPAERVARVVIGGLAAIAGALLMGGAGSTLAVVLELLLVLAGLDLVVTGALGHCPLYARLGHVPASLKERTS
ncbi:YgaP-like transmembrane domain [Pimelobacter simplex]|uniref:YgaP-like transmembrane domain n=1 Tax=Nocardioides simplex TaxID=2045 RepID=UPI003800FD5B